MIDYLFIYYFCLGYVFFFFKQKTAYEMRISDWSSDVCSSDLELHQLLGGGFGHGNVRHAAIRCRQAEQLMQFAGIGHLLDDVRATDQLTVDIQLRNRWPIAEQLDAVADFGVGEYVHPVIRHAKATQDADRLGREAALWRVGLAFHEQHGAVGIEQGLDAFAHLRLNRHGAAPDGLARYFTR